MRIAAIVRALGLAVALASLWAGASLANAPLTMGGPMNLNLSGPLGAILVMLGTAGIALRPRPWWRAAWPLAGLAALAGAGPNLWAFPPFVDGAYHVLRHAADLDRAPADASNSALALAPLGVALAASVSPLPGRAALFVGSAAGAAAACFAYAAFADLFGSVSGAWPRGLFVLAPATALVAWAARYPTHPVLRAAGAQALVLLGLCLATWGLWHAVV